MNTIEKLINYIYDNCEEIERSLNCGCTVFLGKSEDGEIYDASCDWL